ncbi:MAG TPA: hypothetical protein VE737_05120 [Actinomycetota bacterium]|nr:hypothetical protein [Actinomycetota bacterium]
MRRAPLLPIVVLIVSCVEGHVPLSHRLEAGQRLEHRLTLSADITRTLARRTREQRVTATFLISQEILGAVDAAQPGGLPPTPQTGFPEIPSPVTPSPVTPSPGTPSPGETSPGTFPGLGDAGGQPLSPPAPTGSPSPPPAAGTPTVPPVAEARVTLVPESLEVDGRPVEVGAVQDFTVQLGEDGRVVTIAETVAAPQEALEPVGLERLLPRLRPVLPGRPVALGDSWRSETRYRDERGRFWISAISRLTQLGVTDGYEAALVRTSYRSPVQREETFANAVADLTGKDVGAQEAWFALDGFLVRSSTDSVGTYELAFRPPAGDPGVAPVRGSLVVRLHTEMQLISSG